MSARFIQACSTMIGVLLLVAVPAQAGPIRFGDVINVMGYLETGGQLQQLRLRAAVRDPTTTTQSPSVSAGVATPASGGPTAGIATPVTTAALTSGGTCLM